MRTVGRFYLVCALLLTTAHRLPAPIQEVPESPTPTPQLQPNPLPSITPERADPARFAGTWTGKIKIGKSADFDITLVVNTEATSLTQKSMRFGERVHETSHPTTISGQTLSWQGGQSNNVAWTLTPNADGQTAAATTKGAAGVENTAIFKRVQPALKASPAAVRKHLGAKGKQNSGN